MTNDNKFWLNWVNQLSLPPQEGEVICWWQGGTFTLDTICDDVHAITLLTTSDPEIALKIAHRIVFCSQDSRTITGEILIPRNLHPDTPQFRQLCSMLRQTIRKNTKNNCTLAQAA